VHGPLREVADEHRARGATARQRQPAQLLEPDHSSCNSAASGAQSTDLGGQILFRRGQRQGAGGAAAYSVRRNSAMATPSMAIPIAATTPSSTSGGTTQLPQVTPGLSAARTAAGMFRWAKTARRMGSTA
jgi:hypothetical protein